MKTVITGALALVLLASAAPAALAQDRPDRQNDDASHGQAGGRSSEHRAPPQPAAQAAPQPTPRAAPLAPAGQPQVPAGPRGAFRQDRQDRGDRQDIYRGSDGRGRGQNPVQAAPVQRQAPAFQGQPQLQAQPQGQARDWRNDGRNSAQHDAGRQLQGGPQPAARDERYRQDDRYRQDNDRRDEGRRYDDRGRGDNRGYNAGRPPGQDWQRDRPRYDRRDYPFQYSQHQRYRGFAYYPPRGFYVRHWGFGDIVPRSWWAPDYRLSDWWAYGLPIPPIGYEWVRVGDDALLIDIYSGRVVQVAYDIFY
jgi:Ni/Co efflux regulator RcnB